MTITNIYVVTDIATENKRAFYYQSQAWDYCEDIPLGTKETDYNIFYINQESPTIWRATRTNEARTQTVEFLIETIPIS